MGSILREQPDFERTTIDKNLTGDEDVGGSRGGGDAHLLVLRDANRLMALSQESKRYH